MKIRLCIFILILASYSMKAQEKKHMDNFDPNFVHTVFFWLHNPDSEADRNRFENALGKFLSNSKYAKTNFIGTPPPATRDVVDGSFTYSLIVSFDSPESQELYQNEEAHLAFIEEASDLWDKVIVYDSRGLVK